MNKGFIDGIKVSHKLEPNVFSRGIGTSVKKEIVRWGSFFKSRYYRNLIFLLLLPAIWRNKGLRYAFTFSVIGLLVFCANPFTFYLVILCPFVFIAYKETHKWIRVLLMTFVIMESVYVFSFVRMNDYKSEVKRALIETEGIENILIPAEFYPYFQRGIVDNYFWIHNFEAFKMKPKDVLEYYGIEKYIRRDKKRYFWEERMR